MSGSATGQQAMELIPKELQTFVKFGDCGCVREYFDLQHEGYEPEISTDEIAEVKWIDYPKEIQDIIGDAHEYKSLFMGRFCDIDCFYCCLSTEQNYVIKWWKAGKTHQENNAKIYTYQQQIREGGSTEIRGAVIAKPSKDLYRDTGVKHLLVLITDLEVIVLKLDRDCDLVEGTEPKKKLLSFTPNTITASSSYSREVFIGATNGEVYRLDHELNTIDGDSEKTETIRLSGYYDWNSKKGIMKSIENKIPFLRKEGKAVQQLVFDETTSYMAVFYGYNGDALYGDEEEKQRKSEGNEIDFFLYEKAKDKLKWVGSWDFTDEDPVHGEFIVSISAIPKSDSSSYRFVVFTNTGTRFVFGTNSDFFDTPETIDKRSVISFIDRKQDPSCSCSILSCSYALDHTVMVSKDGDETDDSTIWILRPTHDPYPTSLYTKEVYQSVEVKESGIPLSNACVRDPHNLTRVSSDILHHSLLWQHMLDGPKQKCYVMFTEKICLLEINRPVDMLKKRVDQNRHNSYNEDVMTWLNKYHPREAAGCIILLRKLLNSNESVLRIIKGFSDDNEKEDVDISERCYGCQGFFMRVSKLLDAFWRCPILERQEEDGKWKLAYIYNDIPSAFIGNVTEELLAIAELAEAYQKILNGKEVSDEKKRKRRDGDIEYLGKLREYITEASNTLKFLQVLTQRITDRDYSDSDNSFSNAVEDLAESKKFLEEPFGNEKHSRELFKALRELAASISKNDSSMDKILQERCPGFYSEADREVVDITRRLESEAERGRASVVLLDEASQTYLKHISRIFNLKQIITLLKKFKNANNSYMCARHIIDICIEKANDEDKDGIAFIWYKKRNRNSEDDTGRAAFDRRYHCYKLVFDCIEDEEALKIMFQMNDELFNICLYDYMLEKGKLDTLLRHTSSYIVPFLEERSPDHLWIYYARQHDYSNAARKLLEMAEDKKTEGRDIQSRIEWLKLTESFLKQGNRIQEAEKIKIQIFTAEIQREMSKRRPDIFSDDFPPHQLHSCDDIFDKCYQNNMWDLAIRIFSFMPITNNNKSEFIKKFWWNFIRVQLWNEELDIAGERIRTFISTVRDRMEVADTDITVPLLEEFRIRKKGHPLWVVEFFVNDEVECSHAKIFNKYIDSIKHLDGEKYEKTKCEFIHAAAFIATSDQMKAELAHNGAKMMLEHIKNWEKEVIEKRYEAKSEVFRLIKKVKRNLENQ